MRKIYMKNRLEMPHDLENLKILISHLTKLKLK